MVCRLTFDNGSCASFSMYQSYADAGRRLIHFSRCTLFALALLTANLTASEAKWAVNNVTLTPESKLTGRLTVGLSKGDSTFEITSEVRLTSVNDHFVYRDRLVVTGKVGEQGQSSGIVIFDLASRKRLDCSSAGRLNGSLNRGSLPWSGTRNTGCDGRRTLS